MTEDDQRGTPSTVRREEMLADDEISLFDLWDVLVRRKWVMFGVAIAVVMLSVAYSFSRPAVRVVETVVEVGRMSSLGSGIEPIESAETAVSRLNDVIIPVVWRNHFGADMEEGRAPEAELVSAEGGLLRLSVEAPEGQLESYEELLRSVTAALEADHQDELQRRQSTVARRIGLLQEELNEVEATLARHREQRERLVARRITEGASDSDSVGMAVAMQDAMLLSSTRDLMADRRRLRDQIADLEAQQAYVERTQVRLEPRVEQGTMGAGSGLILALGVVLGGMLGIFAAFFREFVARANEHRRERGTARH